ncbi:uncharacterized protein HD556DRAFT_1302556 [Suillus plorans]|uniref:Uncharacterized protein n=1 Tax=Suillus plorans TaxID=116603 RepID=A0A9P7E3Z2_9AGAM|nr:uncharacterized protein HD556DRAFT_1302556 [Suillus plorans]KAG1810207.1 hypothetical protein HD556DRAFT_1302556 [Suillus plorans]
MNTLISILYLALIGLVTAIPSSLIPRQDISGLVSAFKSCVSLQNSCNATTVDLSNFYNYTSCFLLTACMESPAQVLNASAAPATQPRLTESVRIKLDICVFYAITNGNSYMTQQNYIDAYYHQISITPGGSYPDNGTYITGQWSTIAAWTGFCATENIPHANLADWLEYSSVPGVCPAVASCNTAVPNIPCAPQPITDNGSCTEMATQCQFWVTQGLFQNEYCVLASFCHAWSNTDVLLQHLYPLDTSPMPTTAQEAKLSEAVFYNMTGGAASMTQQNVIDAYYEGLTGTWTSLGGTLGGMPEKTDNDGPYPTSTDYVIEFWGIISAWTGFCDTRTIPYDNLADYLSFAATSGYHPTC